MNNSGNNKKNSRLVRSDVREIYLDVSPKQIRLKNQIEYDATKIILNPAIAVNTGCLSYAPKKTKNSPTKLPDKGTDILAKVNKKKKDTKIGE